MFDPGTLFDWRPKPRPTPPANVGGGTDGTNKPGTAPTPIPQPSGGGIPPVNTTTLKPGGLGAANALRCNAPQTWNAREGRCVCANGLLGANCDQSPGLR
jgi:hypothetical protein